MVGHNASYIRMGRIVTVELRAVHILRGELSRAVDGRLALGRLSLWSRAANCRGQPT
jgi:hypothetical protein